MGKPFTSIRFVFDGQRINDEDTADSMGMEDGDEIDALPEQLVISLEDDASVRRCIADTTSPHFAPAFAGRLQLGAAHPFLLVTLSTCEWMDGLLAGLTRTATSATTSSLLARPI